MHPRRYRIWDNEKKGWYEPTLDAANGRLEELSMLPDGTLTMRIDGIAKSESEFAGRYTVVWDGEEFPKAA